MYFECVDYELTEYDIETVPVDGPNEGLKWMTDICDLTQADWVMHDDVTNPDSPFYQHQCGNFVPAPANSCAFPAGRGWISIGDYRDGVARHEAGPHNSHHAQYVGAQGDPYNNLKTVAELQVGAAGQTVGQFLFAVQIVLGNKIAVIEAAELPQPCGAECDSLCAVFRGYLNLPPYTTPPVCP